MEEEFWKLKSRINWLNEGDANTKFFHTSTLNRRRRNKILSLQLDDDSWIYDQNLIIQHTADYFKKLFNSSHIKSSNHPLIYGKISLSPNDSQYLGKEPTEGEILDAVRSFQPFKAPGPDALHPFFYQNYWNIVGASVISFCKKIFKEERVPEDINYTHVC